MIKEEAWNYRGSGEAQEGLEEGKDAVIFKFFVVAVVV